MNKTRFPALIVFLFILPSLAAARDDTEKGRWVTYQVTRENGGEKLDHQIDRNSIRQEGPYKTFWTRIIFEDSGSPSAFNDSWNYLHILSQKFVVDCDGGKMGTRYIDSNMPAQARVRASFKHMTWKSLNRYPAVKASVCTM